MDIATTVEAVGSAVTTIIALGGLSFIAGKFSNSVENLNKTVEKLTGVLDRHIESSDKKTGELSDKINDHETRITVLEKK